MPVTGTIQNNVMYLESLLLAIFFSTTLDFWQFADNCLYRDD
jgi:hypothetical protein